MLWFTSDAPLSCIGSPSSCLISLVFMNSSKAWRNLIARTCSSLSTESGAESGLGMTSIRLPPFEAGGLARTSGLPRLHCGLGRHLDTSNLVDTISVNRSLHQQAEPRV